jgi:hypothetical protein
MIPFVDFFRYMDDIFMTTGKNIAPKGRGNIFVRATGFGGNNK